MVAFALAMDGMLSASVTVVLTGSVQLLPAFWLYAVLVTLKLYDWPGASATAAGSTSPRSSSSTLLRVTGSVVAALVLVKIGRASCRGGVWTTAVAAGMKARLVVVMVGGA